MVKLTIDNFQSIGHAELILDGLTVIVGPSDRGKSALLRAVEAALFNRAGEQFVRIGAKTAVVTLELPEPDAAGVHRVRWEKGKGVNKFDVDGAAYAKVGKGAPDALAAMGFRDTLIGARLKDDGKPEGGRLMRPQVARQFDGIFLLDDTGVFLSEVLVGLSRLSTLQRSIRFCNADARAAKSALTLRRQDAASALAARDALLDVVGLRDRVTQLAARKEAADALARRVIALMTALDARRAAQRVLGVTTLLPPARPPLLETLFSRAAVLRAALALRARLAVQAGPGLLPPRQADAAAAATVDRWTQFRPLAIERRQQLNWKTDAEADVERAQRQAANFRGQMTELTKNVRVCPLCERPWH